MRYFRVMMFGFGFALAACGQGTPPFSNPSEDSLDGISSTLPPEDLTATDPFDEGQNSLAYFQQNVGDRVLFPVDQSALTAEARAILTEQAAYLIRNSGFTALIEGHADERGTRDYNLALGARRAAAARDFLVSNGVSADRLRTVSYGKERPIEICSQERCYAQNRRAVTVLIAVQTGL